MSQDPCSRRVLIACLLLPIRSAAMRRVSSADKTVSPSTCTGTNCPKTSTCGGRPGEKIRSLTFSEARNIAASSAWVDTLPDSWIPSMATEIGATPVAAIAFLAAYRGSLPQLGELLTVFRGVYGYCSAGKGFCEGQKVGAR